jgi:ABC-type branched-subunit amino acid transport system substrate-binding protein
MRVTLFTVVCRHFIYSVLLLIVSVAAARISVAEELCNPVVVAANLPLTGALAVYGNAVREGVEFASSNIPGAATRVRYSFEDNQSSNTQAVIALQRQVSLKPQVYMSGLKPQYMAIRDMAAKLGIPHFVWIFDGNIRPHHENNFRAYVNFKVEPPLFIDYALSRKATRVAIIYVQLPHTDEEYQQHIIPGLQRIGITIIKVEPYSMEKVDFRDIALRLRSYQPDLLILSGFQENLVGIVRAFNSQRMLHDGNAIASYDLLDAAPLLNPREVEGIRVSAPKFVLNAKDERVAEWTKQFNARFGKNPLYTHAYAYDVADAIDSAVSAAGRNCSSDSLTRALRTIDKDGITGKLRFDDSGDAVASVGVGVFRNGIAVPDSP